MFTDNPYESHTECENTPLSHTSSMVVSEQNNANLVDLSDSLPAQNSLIVMQQMQPDYPNITNEQTNSMTVSFTFDTTTGEYSRISSKYSPIEAPK